ncbi:MAG: poly(A) polymerase, partial [Myxococcota bacterium]
ILGAWATLKGAAVGGSLAAWLASALALFESWDGLEPVGLNPEVVEAWRSERRDRMVVLPSVYMANTARHVTRSSSRVLRREWSRARILTEAIQNGQGRWSELFQVVETPGGLQIRLRSSRLWFEDGFAAICSDLFWNSNSNTTPGFVLEAESFPSLGMWWSMWKHVLNLGG